MQYRALLTGALALGTAALMAAPALAADPCAGGLGASQIVNCLRPGGLGATTRGIRPTTAPAGTQAAAPATPHGGAATVNLLVPFGYDSADLTQAGLKALDALAAALKDPSLSGARFEIAGHTDATGADDYNMKLSQRRADAARDYLVHAGIDASRLTAVGYGRSELYDPKHPDAAVNRRVQVTRME